jgi:chitinase
MNNGLYQTSAGPAPVPPGDVLATPGVATYGTLEGLSSNGYSTWFDAQRIAVSLYDPTTEIFYTYDNPETAFLKMLYIDLKVPGGLGGAYVWAVKDDDANGTMVKAMAQGLGIH